MKKNSQPNQDPITNALQATVQVLCGRASGSGFLVNADGLVVTARHVVEGTDGRTLRKVSVRLFPETENEKTVPALVFRSHRQLDFALLWLESGGSWPWLKAGDHSSLRPAQTVYAVGAPAGLTNTITRGIISNPHARFNQVDCIQTDAAIDHGNSGGPLVDEDGAVLGIVAWGFENVDAARFAVPLGYLTGDIAQAIRLGRGKCLQLAYCPACGYLDEKPATWFCRNCGASLASGRVKGEPGGNRPAGIKGLPQELQEQLRALLKEHGFDADEMEKVWVAGFEVEGARGWTAVLARRGGEFIAAAHMPVLVMPAMGLMLDFDQLLTLTASIIVEGGHYLLIGKVLYMDMVRIVLELNEEQAEDFLVAAPQFFQDINQELLDAMEYLFAGAGGSQPPAEEAYPEPQLPNIKMTPRDAAIIQDVLKYSDPQCRELYTLLMEKWARAGFFVETTGLAVVLDVPYGDRTARLAWFSRPLSARRAAIGLRWKSLDEHTGFPPAAVEEYRKKVLTISNLVTTPCSAYMEITPKLTTLDIKHLLDAMIKLARSVVPAKIEPPSISKPVTPDNIRATLQQCDASTQAIYKMLIEGWRDAGGVVQCAAPGRIYLKMENHAHSNGVLSREPHKFNLLVLASPRGKNPANIQVQFGLGRGGYACYLDCMPEIVDVFEARIAALPGFEQKGTVTRLVMSGGFQQEHARILLGNIQDLKTAEAGLP